MYLSTNAGLLYQNRSRSIIEERLLDVINFDIDGITKETFENVRKRLKYENVMKNVLYFLDYKKTHGETKPQTRVTIINMVPTKDEIEEFVNFWQPKVDQVDVNKYNTWLGTQDDLNVGEAYNLSQEGQFDFACSHPWDEMVIGADGVAGLCCLDYELSEQIGDTKMHTIQEIWQSKTMNEYRQKMLNLDYDSVAACKDCNAYIYQKEKTWAKLQR